MQITAIPTKFIGPIQVSNDDFTAGVKVPLATFETPLWYAVNRGARVTKASGGIKTVIVTSCMTRSLLFTAKDASQILEVVHGLAQERPKFEELIAKSSQYTKLQDWQTQIVGNLLYLRFSFTTGGAAGHNMTTKATELLQQHLLQKYPKLQYVSISANYCADKKNSAVNGILGRGKYVIAETLIPRDLCHKQLRALPEEIINLNIKKNLLGSIVAGSVRTANAHFANMLLAFYLAIGQDGANIVEGAQGFTYAEVQDTHLYFSVTLPNVIIGAIGNGKDLASIRGNLETIKCLRSQEHEFNARCLASLAASVVLCGELSLLAAQTNPQELMRSHILLERKKITNRAC